MVQIDRLIIAAAAAGMLASAILPASISGEVIDRIAATVGHQVIAESQIGEEIRVTALLSQKPPDWSDSNRTQTLNRLIDQALIQHEIEATRFPEPPEEGLKLLDQLKTGNKDFETSIASYHLTDAIVARHLAWQVTFLRFVEYRFKPSIDVSDADLRDFYATQSEQWKKEGKPVPTFEDVRPDLERLLTSKYVDQALDRWLGDQRTETAIVIKDARKAAKQ